MRRAWIIVIAFWIVSGLLSLSYLVKPKGASDGENSDFIPSDLVSGHRQRLPGAATRAYEKYLQPGSVSGQEEQPPGAPRPEDFGLRRRGATTTRTSSPGTWVRSLQISATIVAGGMATPLTVVTLLATVLCFMFNQLLNPRLSQAAFGGSLKFWKAMVLSAIVTGMVLVAGLFSQQ